MLENHADCERCPATTTVCDFHKTVQRPMLKPSDESAPDLFSFRRWQSPGRNLPVLALGAGKPCGESAISCGASSGEEKGIGSDYHDLLKFSGIFDKSGKKGRL